MRSCQKLPLYPAEPVLPSSRKDPPLAQDEPFRKGSRASVINILKKEKKNLQCRCSGAPVMSGSERVALVGTCHLSRVNPPLI